MIIINYRRDHPTRNKGAITFVLFLFISLLSIHPVGGQENYKSEIDSLFLKHSSSNNPGVSLVITRKDKVFYSNQVGLANLEYEIPIEKNTKFQAGFLSQQMTAYAILLLEKEEKLALSDDIKLYLPNLNHSLPPISIEQLLIHSSGFHDYWTLKTIAGWRNDEFVDKYIPLQYAYEQETLNFKPGSQVYYSNTNYFLLAEIVAQVSGSSLKDYFQEKVCNPLNLNQTFFNDDFNRVITTKAYYYYNWGSGWQYENMHYYNPGSVGLISTTEDFTKLFFQINSHHQENDQIWKRLSTTTKITDGTNSSYTLGFRKENWLSKDVLYQNGFYNGYRSHMAYVIDDEIGILVWSNNMSFNAQRLSKDVLEVLTSGDKTPVQNSIKINNKKVKHQPWNPDDLKKHEAYYFDNQEFHTKRIYLKHDTLRLHDVDYDSHYNILPIGKNQFKIQNGTAPLYIEFSNSGEKKLLKIYRNNKLSESYSSFIPASHTADQLELYEGYYHSPLLQTSYRVIIENKKVIAKHHRGEDIVFRPLTDHSFVSDQWYFSSLNFIFENGRAIGFYVNTPEIKNLHFKKLF